jgi:hypothetical protein
MAQKLDKNGMPIAKLPGSSSTPVTQADVDLSSVQKVAASLTGQQAINLRQALANNPNAAPGLVVSSGLAGALPDNPIVKAMIEVSNSAIAAKKLTDQDAQKKIATEKWENSTRGKMWNSYKTGLKELFMVGMAPLEFAGGLINEAAGNFKADQASKKSGVPYQKKSIFEMVGGAVMQTDYAQYLKLTGQSKANISDVVLKQRGFTEPIVGATLFPSEESGAGFAARKVALDSYSIPIMKNGKKIGERPYGLFTPTAWVLTGGEIESQNAQVIEFIGEFGASFFVDPYLGVAKLGRIAELKRTVETVAKGTSSAKVIAKATQEMKEIEDSITYLNSLRDKLVKSSLPADKLKVGKLEDQIKEAVKAQSSLADDSGRLIPDYENTARFLSSDVAGPLIDRIAEMDDVVDIWKATRKIKNLPDTFRPALALAKTREEVLQVFAPYVGRGEVTMGVLKAGKKLSPVNTAKTVSHIATKSRQAPITAMAKFLMDSPLGAGPRAVGRFKANVKDKYGVLIPDAALVNNNDVGILAEEAFNRLKVGKVPTDVADDLLRTILTAPTGAERGYTASARVYDAILDANKAALSPNRVEELKKATRLHTEGVEETASYWATRHLNGAGSTGKGLDIITLGGEKITMHGPHISSELLNSYTYMPPAKEIMDIISRVQRLPAGKTFVKVGDFLVGNAWKKSVLVRVPYIARNIMEEQFRLLLTGHVSFFNHPLSATAMWLGKDNGPAWRQLIQRHNKVRYTVYGDSFESADRMADFADEALAVEAKNTYIHLMNRQDIGAESVRAKKSFFVNGGKSVGFYSPRAWEGIASQLRNFHADPMARKVAATLPGREDETVDFFLNGAGKKDYADFVSAKQQPELLQPEMAKAYLFNSTNEDGLRTDLFSRIQEMTGGSHALNSLVARGRFLSGGKTFIMPTAKTEALENVRLANKKTDLKDVRDANKAFADEIKEAFIGTGKWDTSRFQVNIPAPIHGRKAELNAINKFTEGFFDLSQGLEKSTTMGPEFQMKYWDAIHDISQSLDANAIAQLEKVASKGLSKLVSTSKSPVGKNHPVWNAFKSSKKSGREGVLTLDEAHQYAQRVASEHVAELFYNASQKRQLFHMFRLMAPFAQAWADTINKWAMLGAKNPTQVYKIGKTLDWMDDPKSSALYNLTDAREFYDPNQGFFFKDPNSGDRQFFVPFLGTAMAKAAGAISGASTPGGAPFAMGINPMSFNFAIGTGTILPGFGPGVSFPIAALDTMGVDILSILPDSVKEGLENWIYPYGKPDISEQGAWGVLAPGNWTRVIGSVFDQEEVFAQAFKPVMSYLASSGDYDLLDPMDQYRLTEQTSTFSRWFTAMRGLVGLVTPMPAALIPTAIAKDKDGNMILQTALYKQFEAIVESNNFDYAKSYGDFFDLYGPEQVFSIITQGSASSMDTYRMIEKDPSVVPAYPDIFGYIFPNGGYSQAMYKWSLKAKGGRMSTEDLKNRALDILFSATKDRLATRAAAEDWSSETYDDAKRSLTDSFGGGTATKLDLNRFERSLKQLKAAVDDPRFADSEAIAGAREYMILRDSVLEDLAPYGLKTMSNKASEDLRVWLAGWTAKIIDTYPEFGKLFYAVFANELGYEG